MRTKEEIKQRIQTLKFAIWGKQVNLSEEQKSYIAALEWVVE